MLNSDQIKEFRFGVIHYETPSNKAVMGLVTLGQLLAVPYKDSAAGSNPREFQGMKSKTNKKILESLLKNDNIFWALHSGVTVTVVSASDDSSKLEYEDACLTNGLQTVTIAQILAMVKAYQEETGRPEIHTKINRNMVERWQQCIHDTFSPDVVDQLTSIKIEHVNSVLNWLNSQDNAGLRSKINAMSLSDLLNIKVSIKIVLLDTLVPESAEDSKFLVLEKLGYEIAEANNETQKVEAGDLFGSRHKDWLHEKLFKNLQKPIVVEYRRLAEDRSDSNQKVVHVLDLLRAILPTTLIIDADSDDPASFVANYANRREPIYNWFDKIIQVYEKDKDFEIKKVITILRNLMPDLVDMMFLVQRSWEKQRRDISFKAVNEWYALKNASMTLKTQIFEDDSYSRPKLDADSILKKYLGFSFANVFTIFVFATRKAISVDHDFNASYKLDGYVVSLMVEEIYKTLARDRLGQFALGSTTGLFRNPELYRNSAGSFNLIAKAKNLQLDDYIGQYQVEVESI